MGKGKQKQNKRAAILAAKACGSKEGQPTHKQMKIQERNTRNRMRQERNIQRYGDPEWKSDWTTFQAQMEPLGLTLVDMEHDGNCLFRAIADQLERAPNKCAAYRKKICDFISQNREDYEPFIEDDETFDGYLKEMRMDGIWGGQLEIQAASLAYMVNITIHQLDTPRWDIINFPGEKTIHLSYHQGSHYASVRLMGDNTTLSKNQPAPKEIKIVDNSTRKAAHQPAETKKKSNYVPLSAEEYTIMDITGCSNEEFVHQLFIENFGNVQASIEFILMIGPDDYQFQKEFLAEKNPPPKESHHDRPRPTQPQPTEPFVHPKIQKYYQQTPKEKRDARKDKGSHSNRDTDVIEVATVNLQNDLGSMQI